MEKDGSGNSTGKDKELDAVLSAADRGILDAIRDNLDLDTGFAQILGDLAGITPPGRSTGPAKAEPSGHAHTYAHAPDPVLACKVSGAARKIPAPETRREPRYHHKTLTTLALAVITALSITLPSSLSHGAVGARADAGATSPKPIAGEPARYLWYFARPWPHQLSQPFPSGGEQLFPGTTVCIMGRNGRVMLKAIQNQPSGQIGVIITWFPDLM